MVPPTATSGRKRKADEDEADTIKTAAADDDADADTDASLTTKKTRNATTAQEATVPDTKKNATAAASASITASSLKDSSAAGNDMTSSTKGTMAKKPASTAKVTIQHGKEKGKDKDKDMAVMEMPLPPTSLQRTQSTPLELEIQQQVLANCRADMEAKPPPFTKAPPAHLLKFAPTEPEEGYEITGEEDDDDDENNGETTTTTNSNSNSNSNKFDLAAKMASWKKKADLNIPNKLLPVLVLVSVYVSYNVLRVGGSFLLGGTPYYYFVRHMIASIPIFHKWNPYRTPSGHIIPIMPCYRTNIDKPPVHLREECRNVELTFEKCPPMGYCWGGNLQICREPYLQVAENEKSCEMKPPVQEIYQTLVDRVQEWTFDYQCNNGVAGGQSGEEVLSSFGAAGAAGAGDGGGFLEENNAQSPPPYMITTVQETTPPTNISMFALEHVLDMDPFLLQPIRESIMGNHAVSAPVEVLFALLEAANPLTRELKTQILRRYETPPPIEVIVKGENGEEHAEQRQPPPVEIQIHLVALQPSVSNKFSLSAKRQCQLRAMTTWIVTTFEWCMETPWLIMLWLVSMTMLTFWLAVLYYYMDKARRQKEFLELVEDVREHVLETLKESCPKEWRGTELQDHVLVNCPAVIQLQQRNNAGVGGNNKKDPYFYKRVWPRVVFDLRGNNNVVKSITVANADLVDLWAWKSVEQQQQSEMEGTKVEKA